MVLASDVRVGMVLSIEGRLLRVLEIVRHAGSGQMHGFIEFKMKDLRTGHVSDRHAKSADKFDEVELNKRQMEFLYADAESAVFMDIETYDQVAVPKRAVGNAEKFLRGGTRAVVEMLGEEAVSIQFPKTMELRVALTGPGIREGQDNTLKPATLENGLEIMVPQFIETGDMVRVDTEKVKYVERLTVKKIS